MQTLTSTATAFSASRAPCRSSWGAAWVAAGLLVAGCGGGAGPGPARLAAHAPGLQARAGVLRYQGAPYTGTVYGLSPGGDTLATTPYRRGRPHGLARAWYGFGRLRERRRYVAGREEGRAEGWWPNGQRWYRRWFRAGQYHGPAQEWYPTGQRYRHGHYAAGQETGRQQLWQPDGTFRANYETRYGRQYGFIGTKHCATARPRPAPDAAPAAANALPGRRPARR